MKVERMNADNEGQWQTSGNKSVLSLIKKKRQSERKRERTSKQWVRGREREKQAVG